MKLAKSFRALYVDRETGELKSDTDIDELRLLPAHVLERLLLEIIRALPPEATLNVSVLSLFLSPETTSFDLTGSLKASMPLLLKLKSCKSLTRLDLSRQSDLKDTHFAPILAELPNLEEVVLRGCTQVGDASIIALSKACESRLRIANLNYVGVTRKGLISLLARCSNLQVLKLAAVNGLTDSAVQSLVTDATKAAIGWRHVPLSKLRKLKLKSCAVGDAGVGRLLSLTPLLETLDISFSDSTTLDFISLALPQWHIKKLVLSGLKLKPRSLDKLLGYIASLEPEQRDLLHTLKLGSQGLGRVASTISNTTATDLDSLALQKLLPFLQSFGGLRVLSLHGNLALTRRSEPLYELFATVVGRLEKLDLTGISLKAKVVAGLWAAEEEGSEVPIPALDTLILDNTGLDDEAVSLLAVCKHLVELHLASSKVSETALAQLVESCPALSVLNLTGCRSISLSARRDFFSALAAGEIGQDSD